MENTDISSKFLLHSKNAHQPSLKRTSKKQNSRYYVFLFLLIINFEKAFDPLSWDFIHGSLSFFNFGDDIELWFHTFYNNGTACVCNNGFPPDSSLS